MQLHVLLFRLFSPLDLKFHLTTCRIRLQLFMYQGMFVFVKVLHLNRLYLLCECCRSVSAFLAFFTSSRQKTHTGKQTSLTLMKSLFCIYIISFCHMFFKNTNLQRFTVIFKTLQTALSPFLFEIIHRPS